MKKRKINASLFTGSSIYLELQTAADQELYFCAGSLSVVAFEQKNFKKNHEYGLFFRLMELTELS